MTDDTENDFHLNELDRLRARTSQLEVALKDTEESAARRIAEADLKTEAMRNGMIDLDGLKLIDDGDHRVDESGNLLDPRSIIANLKRAKPWLFAATHSSNPTPPPNRTPVSRKPATEMSLEEWRSARAELLRRR